MASTTPTLETFVLNTIKDLNASSLTKNLAHVLVAVVEFAVKYLGHKIELDVDKILALFEAYLLNNFMYVIQPGERDLAKGTILNLGAVASGTISLKPLSEGAADDSNEVSAPRRKKFKFGFGKLAKLMRGKGNKTPADANSVKK